jgi:hypothetical protein
MTGSAAGPSKEAPQRVQRGRQSSFSCPHAAQGFIGDHAFRWQWTNVSSAGPVPTVISAAVGSGPALTWAASC